MRRKEVTTNKLKGRKAKINTGGRDRIAGETGKRLRYLESAGEQEELRRNAGSSLQLIGKARLLTDRGGFVLQRDIGPILWGKRKPVSGE